MSFATITLITGSPPAQQPLPKEGLEVLETICSTPGDSPVPVILQIRAGSAGGDLLAGSTTGQVFIASGAIGLDEGGDQAIVRGQSLVPATAEQFLNEVVLVGRLTREPIASESGKSARSTLAVSRYVQREEVTDWWPIRAFGYSKDKLIETPKGSLVAVHGILDVRTNKDNKMYHELKVRTIRTFKRGGSNGSGGHNPASASAATGYDHETFDNTMPFDWS